MARHLVVIIKNALTFIMTENFPIPLRMLYHIPVKKQKQNNKNKNNRTGGGVGGAGRHYFKAKNAKRSSRFSE